MKKFQTAFLFISFWSVIQFVQACSKKNDDSGSKIESGFYVSEEKSDQEIRMVSFFEVEGRMTSFELKRILWSNGSTFGIFAKGGNATNYSSGVIPGSTSTKANHLPGNVQESSTYHPIDSYHVRGELTKSQATPAATEIKSFTLKRVHAEDFRKRFKAEAPTILNSSSDLNPENLSKQQTDFCQVNFKQSCQEVLRSVD